MRGFSFKNRLCAVVNIGVESARDDLMLIDRYGSIRSPIPETPPLPHLQLMDIGNRLCLNR